jgi:hypothetical protein
LADHTVKTVLLDSPGILFGQTEEHIYQFLPHRLWRIFDISRRRDKPLLLTEISDPTHCRLSYLFADSR